MTVTQENSVATDEAVEPVMAKRTSESLQFIYGDRAREYSKALTHAVTGSENAASFKPLTHTQVAHLMACGLLRTDVEVEAFDTMERGVAARVRYMADEIVRMA